MCSYECDKQVCVFEYMISVYVCVIGSMCVCVCEYECVYMCADWCEYCNHQANAILNLEYVCNTNSV